MDCTIITTAQGRVIEAATAYTAIRSRMGREQWIEVERTDGKLETIAAATITGYAQATKKAKGRIGFA